MLNNLDLKSFGSRHKTQGLNNTYKQLNCYFFGTWWGLGFHIYPFGHGYKYCGRKYAQEVEEQNVERMEYLHLANISQSRNVVFPYHIGKLPQFLKWIRTSIASPIQGGEAID